MRHYFFFFFYSHVVKTIYILFNYDNQIHNNLQNFDRDEYIFFIH